MKKTKFKMTEIGPIPEDWEVKPLSSIGIFSKGSGISRSESNSGVLPCVRYGEIYTDHNDYIKEFKSFISESVAINAKRLVDGDILFAGSGETKEEIGKAVAYLGGAERVYCGGDILVLSPFSDFDSKFLGYVCNSQAAVSQKSARGQGDAVVHIRTSNLAEVLIPVPPLAEQRAIAEALSDVDELLAAMTTLIKKKRAIKQGTMQELLGMRNCEVGAKKVPRRRLPSFSGEWVEKRLGEVLTIGNGKDYKHLTSGTIPVYGTGGLMTYVNDWLYDGATVCIGRKGTIDVPQYHEGKIWTVDTLYYTYDFKDVDIKFLFYLFLRIDWLSYNSATGVPSLTAKAICDIEVCLPPLAEQKAIAEVLSDMDAEIEALEAKRAKYESIKQSMMQELLTGKTRLV